MSMLQLTYFVVCLNTHEYFVFEMVVLKLLVPNIIHRTLSHTLIQYSEYSAEDMKLNLSGTVGSDIQVGEGGMLFDIMDVARTGIRRWLGLWRASVVGTECRPYKNKAVRKCNKVVFQLF